MATESMRSWNRSLNWTFALPLASVASTSEGISFQESTWYFATGSLDDHSGRGGRALLLDPLPADLHGLGSVGAVRVGPALLGELGGHRGAATDDLVLVAHAHLIEVLDGLADVRHGDGQQRGEPHDIRLVLLGHLEDLLRRVVDPDIVDLELRGLEQHADEVLADVVDVPLDGADDGDPDRFRHMADDQRPEKGHGSVHRAGGEQHLGHDILHRWDQLYE